MGRVRTKTVKKSAKVIIERYYPKLTLDFEANKRICDEIAIIASKRLRNKVRHELPCLYNEISLLTWELDRLPVTPHIWWSVFNVVPSVVSPSSFKKRSVSERINTSQKSRLSISPKANLVNSRLTPRRRIFSSPLAYVTIAHYEGSLRVSNNSHSSIPSPSASSPFPNNKPLNVLADSEVVVTALRELKLEVLGILVGNTNCMERVWVWLRMGVYLGFAH